MKGYIENEANKLVKTAFKDIGDDHLINKISANSDLYKNSIILSVGNRGTAKTTHFMKEMIKLSLEDSYCVHLIIYVSNNENNLTFHKLKNFVTIPIIFVMYVDLN